MVDITMQVVNPQIISGKKVLLRYDIDVALRQAMLAQDKPAVVEDFKLKAGLDTLKLCLEHGTGVVMMGHLGRPEGQIVPELSVEPIRLWLKEQGLNSYLTSGKLKLLENLRFDPREEACDLGYARELAGMGDSPRGEAGVYVNEAFSSYRSAVSTTILPTLLPHAAGLRFAEEVRVLGEVRDNPKKPFIAIMGGAKVKDKLPVIKVLAQIADAVLVGGKIAQELTKKPTIVGKNVLIGKLSEDGQDLAEETTQSWRNLIMGAKMIVWNGPLGKFEDPKNEKSAKIAKMVVESEAETVVGGGDTLSLLGGLGLLGRFGFVSVGGGAMLKLLSDGTLPTIEALR